MYVPSTIEIRKIVRDMYVPSTIDTCKIVRDMYVPYLDGSIGL